MTTLLSNLTFKLCGGEFCCGIYELGRFQFAENNRYVGINVKKFEPKEVFAKFDKELRGDLWDEVDCNGSGGKEPGYYWVQCSIVPKDSEGHALLLQHLKDTRWKTIQKFQNHNTHNEVFVLGKKFKFTVLKREFGSKDDDYWD